MSETKLLCAWCGVALDEQGVEAYAYASGCDTCGGANYEIEIYCRNKDCPKYNEVIYKKESE